MIKRALIIIFLIISLVSCVNEPPDRVFSTTPNAKVEQLVNPPSIEDSVLVKDIWRKGYFKYGVPLGLPYAIVYGSNKEFTGLVPDLADELAKQMGFPSLTMYQRWGKMPADLENDSIHALIGAPAYRPEFRDYEFIKVGERGHCLITGTDNENFIDLINLGPGVRLALAMGSDSEILFSTNFPGVETVVVEVVVMEDVVKAVIDRDADVVVVYSPIAQPLLSKYPDLRIFPKDCNENPILPVPWGIHIKTYDALYTQYVQQLVLKLEASGWMSSRIEKWQDQQRLEKLFPKNNY